METLKSSNDISVVFANGKRFHLDGLALIISENGHKSGRVAFAAGRKLGNAVWRNRAKRRMRSLCKDLDFDFKGYDAVFLAKASVNEKCYAEMLSALEDIVEREIPRR